MGERIFRPRLDLDKADKRPRPVDEPEITIATDAVGNVTHIEDPAAERAQVNDRARQELSRSLGQFTEQQWALAQSDYGFLAFTNPDAKGKQVVAIKLEPIASGSKITGWRVAEISGGADLGVYVDDQYRMDLSNMPVAVRRCLDTFVRLAGTVASSRTRELQQLKEVGRTNKAEFAEVQGTTVRVDGGEVKLASRMGKKGPIVEIVGVVGRPRFAKGTTYTRETLPRALSGAVSLFDQASSESTGDAA